MYKLIYDNKMKHKFYILDITNHFFISKQRYNAAGKPRTDSLKIAESCGGILKQIDTVSIKLSNNRFLKKIESWWNLAYSLLQFFLKYRNVKNSVVFIQYPFINMRDSLIFFILKKLKKQGNKFITLVHDLEFFRNDINEGLDRFILEYSDVSIVHSPNMLNIIDKRFKVNDSICLEFFDYVSNLDLPANKNLKNIQLIYAGNLMKSEFLKEINKVSFNNHFKLNLYGTYCDYIKENDFVKYKGRFDAEQFSDIEGNWGLVWDGTSVDTCEGKLGNYLRYNSPFKMSLYLAAKKPVVVWRESAMAEYVEKYNIGICVNSLNEIRTQIEKLSDKELAQIQQNVNIISKEVRSGNKLKLAICLSLKKIISNKNWTSF